MAKLVKTSNSNATGDAAAVRSLEDAVNDTSRCLLVWIEAAAAAICDDEQRIFPPGALN